MKSVLRLFFILIIVTACKEDAKEEQVAMDSYIIQGNAPGVVNGIRAYLKTQDNRGRFIERDTAVVMNGEFTFTGKADKPEIMTLHVNSVNGSLPFILENGKYEVSIDKDNINNSKLTGTQATEAMLAYNSRMAELNTENREHNSNYRTALRQNDTVKLKQLTTELQQHNNELQDYPHEFIRENKNNPFSLTLIEGLMRVKDADVAKIETSYNQLSDNLKSSDYAKSLEQNLNALKQQRAALAFLDVGKTPPNFTAPNPEGKMIALNDIKGKATIIDFWAAWCGPCRRENPNVVRVYEKYKDKGLEIIGVSLDGSSRQNDPKAAWVKAIKDDNLTWHQVSNLKYFNDPVAKMYNINSIPATYILDSEGKIAAKNLRGPALEQKIAELLN